VPGTQEVRLAIVGCGAIALELHIPAALAIDDVRLVALVDTDDAQLANAASVSGGAAPAQSLRDVADDVDAVILATPPHVRPALAEEAFGLGLHVLCEKPLANTAAECDRIISAAAGADRVLAVGHVLRFSSSRVAVKDILDRGELGRIRLVTIEQGRPYTWTSASGYTVRREMVPGGVLINAGIHPLDSLLWWFGDPLSFDYEDDSIGGLESNARLSLQFAGDVTARLRQSRTCLLANEIRIEGDQASLRMSTGGATDYTIIRDGQETTHQSRADGSLDEHADHEQLLDFVESVRSGRSPRVNGQEGKRVVALIEACYAAKRDRPAPERIPVPGATW